MRYLCLSAPEHTAASPPDGGSTASRAAALAAAAALACLAAWLLVPADYWPKFRSLIETVRAIAWLAAAMLATRAAAPGALWVRVQAWADRAEAWLGAKRGRLWRVVAAMALVYVAVWGSFTIVRHERFNSSTYDLAVYDQAVWNTTRGRWLETSIEAKPGQYLILLGDHFAPILTFLVPLYWLWPSVHALLLSQAVILASGAFAVCGLAAGRLGSKLAGVVFAGVYLLCPAIGFINRFDFHPAAIAIPLFLAAVLCVERRRMALAAACLGAAMLCKEDMGLAVAVFGLVIAFAHKRRAWGFSLFGVGLAGSLLAMFVVLPAVRGEQSDTWERYEQWGQTPIEAAAYLLSHPMTVLDDVVRGSPLKLGFLLKAMLPFAFLPMLGLGALAPALPAFAYNLASGNPSQSSIYFHYAAPILPFLFYAAIVGAQRVARGDPQRRVRVLLVVAASTLAAYALDCPLAKRVGFPYWEVHGLERTCDVAALREVARHVPAEASLGATMPLGPHFSHRRNLRLLWPMKSAAVPDVDYLFVDLSDFRWNNVPSPAGARRNLVILIARALAKGYGLEAHSGPAMLLRRNAATRASQQQVMAMLDTYLGSELRDVLRSATGAE